MKIGKQGVMYALNTAPGQMIIGLLGLLNWILSWFVMSTVIFLRRDYGENFLSWVNIFFGWFAVGLFTGLGNWLLSPNGHMSRSIEIAYYVVVIVSIYHRFIIWRKNKAGVIWYSQNPGCSFINFPGLSSEVVHKWIEPGILFVGAYVAYRLHDNPMKIWLMVSGFGLMVHEQVSYYLERQRLLAERDIRIIAEVRKAVLQEMPVTQTAGFSMAKSNVEFARQTAEHFAAQPKDVEDILDKE